MRMCGGVFQISLTEKQLKGIINMCHPDELYSYFDEDDPQYAETKVILDHLSHPNDVDKKEKYIHFPYQ